MQPPLSTEAEVERVKDALRRLLWEKRMSLRELDRRLGRSENYFSQVLRGKFQLTVTHVFQVLEILDVEPEAFFHALYAGGKEEARRSSGRSPEELDPVLTLRMAELIREAGRVAGKLIETREAGPESERNGTTRRRA